MPTLAALLRYPVKSARAERLSSAAVDAEGLRWDRQWACLDAVDGTVGSAKHPGRWAWLLEVGATTSDTGEVVLQVAGSSVVAGTPAADTALTALVGRPVRLTTTPPATPRLHRQVPDDPDLIPEWMADVEPGSEVLSDVPGARAGRFVDFGALHLVTTGALAQLASQAGRADVDPVRFRPNLVIDAPRDPEPGERLRVGDLVLQVASPTVRCVVPGLDPTGATPPDRELLATVARHHRRVVPGVGRGACFGVYAEVLEPGSVVVGDPVLSG
ncbi:hypothetical protein EV189_3637 [Motilibacter rhizosphaerae]|uniref:MOSC domain-containing protein n=1 Tax=Motilibacter rhizosphaerae TaxID=598652 RepID=A0A4Q7NB51_9ACTN|nr:MOSC domain-containing protein [Motilibacter rhizosphaerae]RZS80156.1 hypothetical protein EV189_3637 [Motilibacter rhizosphaerae]